jgi:mRNA-degrading endonuclease RelE of RelBE toxin-antitoxin system
VISRTTPSFWRTLTRLNRNDREAARRSVRLFVENPGHNSLSFKKLSGHADLWSARVNLDVRAVAQRHGDTVTWVWIGKHSDFDKLFN